MPRRRGRKKGSGSVYKTKDGWCAQREAPRVEGKRRYERRFFRTRVEALNQVSAWERERVARASHPRATDATGNWLAYWLTTKRGTVAPSTLEYYTRHIGYALPHIGPIPLYALEPAHIRDVLAAPSLLKPQSRKHVRTVLSMALQLAVNEGIIPRNPCATVEPPKVERYRAYALSDAELQALFAAVAGTRLEPFWRLMADYGMRLDELSSAHWVDYDMATGKLHIRATKTGTERWLELTDDHQGRLAAWRDALAVEAEDAPRRREMGYLFPSEAGTKLLASNVRRAFKEALDRAELPRVIRVHDLRHTAATNLIAAGNDIPTVQYITGHKDTKVLLEIYAHYQQGRDREAVERVEAKRRKKS
jgi:integrase